MLLFMSGLALGTGLAMLVFSFRINRDERFINDLIDRLHCKDAGDYLLFLTQRDLYGKKPEPWYKNVFPLKPLMKHPLKNIHPNVPSVGELETQAAKAAAARATQEDEDEQIAHTREFDRQQDERIAQHRDTVIP